MVYNVSTNLILWRQIMLTNNKKSCFVKGIAMMLAMLMVLAVCLTGCTDKTARNTADEAKTLAQETADKLTEALKGYLKTSDVEATVNALIKDALKDADTIKDFATSKQLDDLAAKLANYVAKDDLSATIKAELAKIDLTDALKDVMTADQIKKLVDEKLKDYYTKDEIDKRLKSYFGDLAPAEVLAALTAQVKGEGAMSEKEWNEATPVVLEAIKTVQDILKKVYGATAENYTDDAKQALNAALGIEVFEKSGSVWSAADQDTVQKYLEYKILRVASLKEMDEFKASVDAANAVPTLESELRAIEARLLALGTNLSILKPDGKVDDTKKYTADDLTYRDVAVKNGDLMTVKAVTYADKAAFAAINADYDAVFVKYANAGIVANLNPTAVDGNYETAVTVRDIWKVVNSTTGAVSYRPETTAYKGSPRAGEGAPTLTVSGSTVSYVGSTVDDTGLYADAFGGAATLSDSKKVYAFGKVTATAAASLGSEITQYGTIVSDAKADATPSYADAYGTVYEQLKNCQTAINAANDIFTGTTGFLRARVAAGVSDEDYAKLTDADFLAKLTAIMCEPADRANYSGSPDIYLTKGLATNVKNVEEKVSASYKINGSSYIGIDKIGLYQQMMEKSYDLLFPKYQQIAFNVLDRMEQDYKDLVAKAANGTLATGTGATTIATVPTEFTAGTFGQLFLDGKAADAAGVTAWEIGPTNYTFYGLKNYYTDNKSAYIPKAPANQAGSVPGNEALQSNPLNSLKQSAVDININLGAATLAPRAAIMSATAESLKSDKAVNKAFDDILQTALNNLNEVMNRYLLKDYKTATLNHLYAAGDDIAKLYSIKTNADANVVIDITSEVEKYLTGYSKSKDSYGFTYTTKDDKVTGIANKNAKYGIAYASVKDALDKIDASKTAAIDGNNVAMVGTEAMSAVNALNDSSKAMMEEFVIRKSFNAYLSQSKNALTNAFSAYSTAFMGVSYDAAKFETYLSLQQAYNLAMATLTVTEYEANRGDIKMGEYKARLKGVLNLIVADGIDSTVGTMDGYAGMLTAMKIDRDELKKNIKSSTVVDLAVYTGLTQLSSYDWAGSAMVDFDRIVNANAYKVNAEGAREYLYR